MTDDRLRRTFRDLSTARVATLRPDGSPFVAPHWFVWAEDAVYVSVRMGSATWENVERDARIAIVIDHGREWTDLAGVEIEGTAAALPAEHPEVRGAMSAWHEKYRTMLAGDGFERMAAQVPELGFLHVVPGRVDAWDHR